MRSALMVRPIMLWPRFRCCLYRLLLLLPLLLPILLITDLEVVLAQDSVSTAALCDSARALLMRGDTEGARVLYERALDQDREYPPAVLGMGMTLLEVPRQTRAALTYLRRASSLMPDDPNAHFQRARAHLRLAETDFGRDNANQARQELEQVIALDPSHGEAYHLLGTLYMEVYRDYDQAVAAFRRQTEANPGNLESRFEYVRALMDMGMFEESVLEAEALRRRAPDDSRVYPYLAGAYWKQGRLEEAMRVFEDYFGRIEPKERDLYFDLSLILTTAEVKEFEGLSAEGRQSWWNHYWSTRDPDPKTAVNERLLEHFVRVDWARLEFGQKVWPWDAQGEMYVRYGEPDVRAGRGRAVATDLITEDWEYFLRKKRLYEELGLTPPVYVLPGWTDEDPLADVWVQGSATPIQWFYLDRGLQLNFEDPVMSGRYRLVRSILTDQLSARKPVISEKEDVIQYVDPADGVFSFRGAGGKTVVEYAFALLPDDFGQFRSVTGDYATIDVDVVIYTPEWEEVARAGDKARRLQTVPQVTVRGIPLFVDATRLEVAPGPYRIATLLLDPVSGRRGAAEEIVEVPDYSGLELNVSDILPAATIREVPRGTEGRFVRGNLEVLPLPGRALQTDQPLYIYYEVYNLAKDAFGATDYEVAYAVAEAPDEGGLGSRLFQGLKSLVGMGQRRSVLTARTERSGIESTSREWLQVDMSEVPAGTYLLELTITDRLTGQSTGQRLLFRTLPVM